MNFSIEITTCRETYQGKNCKKRIPLKKLNNRLELYRTFIHDRNEDALEAAYTAILEGRSCQLLLTVVCKLLKIMARPGGVEPPTS